MNKRSGKRSTIALRTYRWEGAIFNILCGIYFLWLAPTVVDAANTAMRDPEAKVIWLGILLALISLAEVYAFPLKMRFVNEAIRDQGDTAGRAFYLWLFHAVISMILLFLIASCFGFKLDESNGDEMPVWLMVLIPTTVIKELVFSGFLLSDKPKEAPPDPKYARPQVREWIVDFILVVYACVAYSATWGALTRGMTVADDHPVLFVLNLLLCTLLFLIFYMPLRIPYWVEELAQVKSKADRLKLAASILVVLVPTVIAFL